MFTLAKQSQDDARPGSRASPMAIPDPTLPARDLQQPERELFKNKRRALGARAADRHQGGVDGGLSRRGDDLGDRRAADRHASRQPITSRWRPGSRISSSTPASARSSPTTRPSASRSPTCCGPRWASRSRRIPKEIAKAFGMGWWKPDPQAATELLEKAGFKKRGGDWQTPDGKPFTVRVMVEGDAAAGHDPRRLDDRAAMAAVRHRRQDRRRAGHAARRAAARAISTPSSPGASRPGAATRTCPTSSTAGIRSSSPSRASRSRCATGSAGRTPSSTRSSSRPARSASTTRRAIELGKDYVKLARAGDADHPADGLQRLHRDGPDLLDGLSRPRRTPTPTRCRTGATRAT